MEEMSTPFHANLQTPAKSIGKQSSFSDLAKQGQKPLDFPSFVCYNQLYKVTNNSHSFKGDQENG